MTHGYSLNLENIGNIKSYNENIDCSLKEFVHSTNIEKYNKHRLLPFYPLHTKIANLLSSKNIYTG